MAISGIFYRIQVERRVWKRDNFDYSKPENMEL